MQIINNLSISNKEDKNYYNKKHKKHRKFDKINFIKKNDVFDVF